MHGKIYRYLADDHRRLDALLEGAMSNSGNIDGSAYAQCRAGLLKHIGMEEKVLLPAAQKLRGASRFPSRPSCAWITARWLRCACRRPTVASVKCKPQNRQYGKQDNYRHDDQDRSRENEGFPPIAESQVERAGGDEQRKHRLAGDVKSYGEGAAAAGVGKFIVTLRSNRSSTSWVESPRGGVLLDWIFIFVSQGVR